jgi:two-component system, response regulator
MGIDPVFRATRERSAVQADAGRDRRAPAEILMVEDSATDAELAARALTRARIAHPLKVIFSGEEALHYLFGTGKFAKYGSGRPLLILLDLQLPGMSGIDFLRQIKNDERTWDIPVVSLSLTKSAPAIVKFLQLGVVHHIIKPVTYAALAEASKRLNLKLDRIPAGKKSTADSP